MMPFILAISGLITSLFIIRLYLAKSGVKIPQDIPLNPGKILMHSAMITTLIVPLVLWAIAATMWLSAFHQALQGMTIQTSPFSLIGACWSPTLFCLGIFLLFGIADHLQKSKAP